MINVFVGPLWANQCEELIRPFLNERYNINFYGGYNFFGKHGLETIDWLLVIKSKHPIKLRMSRFEEHFLITANILSEKNFNFRRWINPFSGIISAIESYHLATQEIFENPEKLHEKLRDQILKCGHFDFYQSLESNSIFPVDVLSKIENSILTRLAFEQLSIYDEKGEVLSTIKIDNALIDQYLSHVQSELDRFSIS